MDFGCWWTVNLLELCGLMGKFGDFVGMFLSKMMDCDMISRFLINNHQNF